jgi:hypothetical protein
VESGEGGESVEEDMRKVRVVRYWRRKRKKTLVMNKRRDLKEKREEEVGNGMVEEENRKETMLNGKDWKRLWQQVQRRVRLS